MKILFIISIITLLIPSTTYLITNKTVFGFNNYYTYTLTNQFTRVQEGIMYIAVFLLISILYILVIKNRNKLFKNTKQIGIYIAIVSMLFLFMIPSTSSDVYYYLGVGRIQNEYNANPYYESINDVIENNEEAGTDEILQNTPEMWREITVVYGPVWTLVCNILTLISLGSVTWLLFVFKIFNFVIHMINCQLIYKITKKKLYVLIYGLNPLLLFETIANVHNDIFIVFFILMALYFLLKKKNILLSVVFLAIAAGIKYFTIMLLPFILIYHFRKEKVGNRLLKCIKYGIIFVVILLLFYLIYAKDLTVLNGLSSQQNKIAKSLSLCMWFITLNVDVSVYYVIQAVILCTFVFIYIVNAIKQLVDNDVKFSNTIRRYTTPFLIFIFAILTTFQPWYIVWILPFLMWQKSETQKVLISVTLLTNIANSIFVFFSESVIYGIVFVILMSILTLISICINCKIKKKEIM